MAATQVCCSERVVAVEVIPVAVALDIAEGRLVKLADVVLLEDFAYYLVFPEVNHKQSKVAAFRAWILNAASKEMAMSNTVAG